MVEWHHLVWFSSSIPKHSFILWLAINRKLMTQDRMQIWQTEINLYYPFCMVEKDSVDHLFFNCNFCREAMRFFVRKGVFIPEGLSWDQVVSFAANSWKGKSVSAIVNKIVLGTLVYLIWKERNKRLFQSQIRSLRQFIDLVEEVVRFKIMTLKVRRNTRVTQLLERWNISTRVDSNS